MLERIPWVSVTWFYFNKNQILMKLGSKRFTRLLRWFKKRNLSVMLLKITFFTFRLVSLKSGKYIWTQDSSQRNAKSRKSFFKELFFKLPVIYIYSRSLIFCHQVLNLQPLKIVGVTTLRYPTNCFSA